MNAISIPEAPSSPGWSERLVKGSKDLQFRLRWVSWDLKSLQFSHWYFWLLFCIRLFTSTHHFGFGVCFFLLLPVLPYFAHKSPRAYLISTESFAAPQLCEALISGWLIWLHGEGIKLFRGANGLPLQRENGAISPASCSVCPSRLQGLSCNFFLPACPR